MEFFKLGSSSFISKFTLSLLKLLLLLVVDGEFKILKEEVREVGELKRFSKKEVSKVETGSSDCVAAGKCRKPSNVLLFCVLQILSDVSLALFMNPEKLSDSSVELKTKGMFVCLKPLKSSVYCEKESIKLSNWDSVVLSSCMGALNAVTSAKKLMVSGVFITLLLLPAFIKRCCSPKL